MPHRIDSVTRSASLGPGLFPVVADSVSGVRPTDARTEPSEEPAAHDWTEEEIVLLHWRLLQDVAHLCDPTAPLEEKLSTLRWVFTDPDKDEEPFSFVNCLRVVGCSPLSPIAYCGRVDAQEIRDHIASNVRCWLTQTLAHYPPWVAQALADNPTWFETELARNPQWINEQVRRMAVQDDLFADPQLQRAASAVASSSKRPS